MAKKCGDCGASPCGYPGECGTTIVVSRETRADVIEALRSLAVCAEGDSNDDEIDAGRNCAHILQHLLGITEHELSTED